MGEEHELERTEVEAVLETRRELGSSYDRALVDSFADRIEAAVAARTAHDLERRGRADRDRGGGQVRQFVLGIISLTAGIPVTIVPMVAADNGLPAVVVAWLGIAGVNAAHAAAVNGPRRPRPDGR